MVGGDCNTVEGFDNTVIGDVNLVEGTSNYLDGSYNTVGGDDNDVVGGSNYVYGSGNTIISSDGCTSGSYCLPDLPDYPTCTTIPTDCGSTCDPCCSTSCCYQPTCGC